MVKDRGTIKWTSLMLPEHVEMLKQMWKENSYQTKPKIDEQQLMLNNRILSDAIKGNKQVEISYFNQHDFHTIKGQIKNYNTHLGSIQVVTHSKNLLFIELKNITEVKFL